MAPQVRRTALLVFVLFGALFLNLNWLQVIRADDLADNELNRRQLLREYEIQRGSIIAGSGPQQREIATSVETDDALRYLRVYPEGERYAHVTGFYSFIFGRAQLERTFNDALVGSGPEAFVRNLSEMLEGGEQRGDTVVTTLVPAVQETAMAALSEAGLRGAVAAINPTTGEVLALASAPTYDPNALSSHDAAAIRSAWETLEADPQDPQLSRATAEVFPPGSAFKVVVAAAALQAGIGPEEVFPDPRVFDVPQTTADIGNFGDSLCNGGQPLTLAEALAVSCNTTFADLSLRLGPRALVTQAQAFGFNTEVAFELPLATSAIPAPELLDPPATAQSAIGQRDVRATPLQMALIAGAIGNDGLMMQPRLVREIQDFAGLVIEDHPARPIELPGGAQVLPAGNAATLTEMMIGVVENGTGGAAAIPGVTVAGKTGTAQTSPDRPPTVWFIAFAPADNPRVAVAVVVEEGGNLGESATGGGIAAPIARTVMQAALQQP